LIEEALTGQHATGKVDTGRMIEAILYILKKQRDFSYSEVAYKFVKNGRIYIPHLREWVARLVHEKYPKVP
jgi:hypothetical protein